MGYEESATLPPRLDRHVAMWLAIFSNFGTACNYLSAIRWACKVHSLSLAWDSDRLRLVVNGGKKVCLSSVEGKLKVKFLITSKIVRMVVVLADKWSSSPGLSIFVLLAWEFLGRVQSEIVPLERGSQAQLVSLPAGRHSAVVLLKGESVYDDVCAIRWMKRKHRQHGSLRKRPCTCRVHGEQFCVVHRLQQWFEVTDCGVGARLYPPETWVKGFSERKVAAEITRLLVLLGIEGAKHFTWKSFRAGRATEMAAQGFTLDSILAAGEWRSAAFARYIDTDQADMQQVLRRALQHSEDEEEDVRHAPLDL